jgi:hypothetical protein
VNRLLSTDAFAVSAPIRMLTGGKYGASNLLEMFPALQALSPAVAKGEADFARANESALEAAAQAGESAMALPGLQELGAVEGGIAGTLKAMRNAKTMNAIERLLPTADDASRTMGMSGVLSMDEASRMARAKEMGFDTGTKWLHGTSGNHDQFSSSHAGSVSSGDGRGFWFTQSPRYAGEYAENRSG